MGSAASKISGSNCISDAWLCQVLYTNVHGQAFNDGATLRQAQTLNFWVLIFLFTIVVATLVCFSFCGHAIFERIEASQKAAADANLCIKSLTRENNALGSELRDLEKALAMSRARNERISAGSRY